MNILITELKKFSIENWWIYLLLTIALIIVYITGKWNLVEILLLFMANFLWNLAIMVMQANYSNKNNKVWSIYHVLSSVIFILISLYGLLKLWQSQYIIWQIAFTLAAIKAFVFYNYKKDLNILNEYSFIALNLILFISFVIFTDFEYFQISQAIWFSLITTGLVSIIDKTRYWLNLVWVFLLSFGSGWWVYNSFFIWNIDWIALGFFILTLTVFIYYSKLLPKYLKNA